MRSSTVVQDVFASAPHILPTNSSDLRSDPIESSSVYAQTSSFEGAVSYNDQKVKDHAAYQNTGEINHTISHNDREPEWQSKDAKNEQNDQETTIQSDEHKMTSAKASLRIPSKDDPNTFAACLQIMDDNHFLIEWIAYHYHVMPLRRLIVFIDPHSETSPQHILDRWKDRIDITFWDNESYVYPQGIPKPNKNGILMEHRNRQRQFVRRCLQTFHKEGRDWVFLFDTDEYAMINERVHNPQDPLSPFNYAPEKNITVPHHQEHGSVLKFLQMKDVLVPNKKWAHAKLPTWNNPCITVGRKVFGTKEIALPKQFSGFSPNDFQTLRWKRFGKDPRPGKSIVNLKLVKYENIGSNPSIHRPLSDEICKGKMWLPEDMSAIIANHYPGTLKQMLFRKNDARGETRNSTAYRIERFEDHKKRYSKFKESNQIDNWLPGFIDVVGEEEAHWLLQDVGDPEKATSIQNSGSYQKRSLKVEDTLPAAIAGKEATNTEHGERADTSAGSQVLSTNSSNELKNSPQAAAKDDLATFAGCLQIMDDNHFLIEWIAYHYHVMPLRRLIVFTDPHARTSPQPILDRWKNRMSITLWNETFVYPNGIPPPPSKKKKTTRLGEHRSRQRRFVKLCLQQLHREGREWVVLTDTDEYTMINNRVRSPKSKLSPLQYASPSVTIPSQREPGSVMKFLQMKEIVLRTGQHLYDNPCITMARKTFGTKAMDSIGSVSGYKAADFQTLNWRYFVDDGKPGKTLVNLKHVKYKDIPQYPSVHRPFTKEGICQGVVAPFERHSVLVANHYPGSLQQMLFRVHDARGNHTNATSYRVERFEAYKKFDKNIESDRIQQWLPGFIETVGESEAKRLLEFVGKPELAAPLAASPLHNPYRFQESQLENEKEDSSAELKEDEVDKLEKSLALQDELSGSDDEEMVALTPKTTLLSQPDDAGNFSACLYLKDDNEFLVEWIAYHFHVLPLRRLIVFSDPSSQTSPAKILDRWKELITISLWDSDNFLGFNGQTPPGTGTSKAWEFQFVPMCLRTLVEEEHGWVMITTVNEYVKVNERVWNAGDILSPLSNKSQQVSLPSHSDPGSISKLLGHADIKIPHTGQPLKDNRCITMAKKTFGTKELSYIPPFPSLEAGPLRFQTLRWRYYDDEGGAGKSLLNLKQIPTNDIPRREVSSVNRPIRNKAICAGTLKLKESQSVIVVNRYPRYSASVAEETLAKDSFLEKETMQTWLSGFIKSVGETEATRLLKNVGQNDDGGLEPA